MLLNFPLISFERSQFWGHEVSRLFFTSTGTLLQTWLVHTLMLIKPELLFPLLGKWMMLLCDLRFYGSEVVSLGLLGCQTVWTYTQTTFQGNILFPGMNSGSHGDKNENGCPLGHCTMWSHRYWPKFRKSLLPDDGCTMSVSTRLHGITPCKPAIFLLPPPSGLKSYLPTSPCCIITQKTNSNMIDFYINFVDPTLIIWISL
jgi:hypothetical protein